MNWRAALAFGLMGLAGLVSATAWAVDGISIEAGRGNEHNFASEADVVAKFEKLAIRALPKAQVEELRDAMLGIEKLPAAARVGELLTLR
jgi:hypothetical protein